MMGGRGIGGLDTGRERRWPRRKILVIIGGVWGGGGCNCKTQFHTHSSTTPLLVDQTANHYCAGGCGFKPRVKQHSGSLNN